MPVFVPPATRVPHLPVLTRETEGGKEEREERPLVCLSATHQQLCVCAWKIYIHPVSSSNRSGFFLPSEREDWFPNPHPLFAHFSFYSYSFFFFFLLSMLFSSPCFATVIFSLCCHSFALTFSLFVFFFLSFHTFILFFFTGPFSSAFRSTAAFTFFLLSIVFHLLSFFFFPSQYLSYSSAFSISSFS